MESVCLLYESVVYFLLYAYCDFLGIWIYKLQGNSIMPWSYKLNGEKNLLKPQ